MHATGPDYPITASGYTATISGVGGALRTLHHNNIALVDAYPTDSPRPAYHGSPLAPWPNRLANGSYEFNGVTQQTPITEPAFNTALHGLVCWIEWAPVQHTEDSVTLETLIHPQPGYPHRLRVSTSYSLSPDGLTWTLTARNEGQGDAPVGLGFHPYLCPPAPDSAADSLAPAGPTVDNASTADSWSLRVPADSVLEANERNLPVAWRPAAELGFDLRNDTPLAGMRIDHCFGDLNSSDSEAHVELRGPGGSVHMRWNTESAPWVQVFTSDLPDSDHYRTGVAIEPMTCPPDAFNSGVGLVTLSPNEELTASLRISIS